MARRKGKKRVKLVVALALVGLLGWAYYSRSSAADQFGSPADTLSVADARAALDRAPVADPASMDGYNRAEFGKDWVDTDHNGCSTRQDILTRDAKRTGGYADHKGCKVTAIKINEPYAGRMLTKTSDVDIDHVVPLAAAWRSGAADWPSWKRVNLANDPRNLLAVDDGVNQGKGDKTPDAWLPIEGSRCVYAQMYVTVLSAYELKTTPAAKAALKTTLEKCPS